MLVLVHNLPPIVQYGISKDEKYVNDMAYNLRRQ